MEKQSKLIAAALAMALGAATARADLKHGLPQRLVLTPIDVPVLHINPASLPPFPSKRDRSPLYLFYWNHYFVRPMMDLPGDYSLERTRFCLTAGPDQDFSYGSTGTPRKLNSILSFQWENLQKAGEAVGKCRGLSIPDATAFYVGDGWIMTAGHVADAIIPRSRIVWPDGETSILVLQSAKFLAGHDVALARVDPPPKQVPSLRSRVVPDFATAQRALQIAVIGYPPRYGALLNLYALPPRSFMGGNDQYPRPVLSPGMAILPDGGNPRHDCATEDGSSGSPVIDLPSGDVIGVHCRGVTLASRSYNEYERVPSSLVKGW